MTKEFSWPLDVRRGVSFPSPPTACLSVHVRSHEHSWWFTYWRYLICYPERERGEASHVWCIFGPLLWLCFLQQREDWGWFDTAYVILLPLIMHYDLFLCLSVNHVVICHFGPGENISAMKWITVKCDFLFRATRFVVLSALPGWLLVGLPWQQIQKSAFVNC